MAFLTFGGTDIPVAPGSWVETQEPRAPEARGTIAGSMVSSITSTQGYVSVWSFTTPLMLATAAVAIDAALATGVAVTASGTLLGAATSVFASGIELEWESAGLHARVRATLREV